MNSNTLKESPAGKYVPTRIGLSPYLAFVPNPLPPIIEVTWPLVNLLGQADRAISELVGICCNLPNSNLLIAPFMRREAVLSSMIEGTQTTMSDLLAFQLREAPLPGFEDARAPHTDNLEVNNYVKAMDWGAQVIKDHGIDEGLLLELHRRLLSGVRGDISNPGSFREEQNYIGPSRDPETATFFPPPVPEMRACMKDLLEYLQREDVYPPLIRLGILHYQFEAVHPFRDGNGRIGRLLLILMLMKWGLLPAPLLYLSAAFEKDRQTYYQLLLEVSRNGEWEKWLQFFLGCVRDQARDAVKRGALLIALRDQWRARLIEKKASTAALKLSDLLFEVPIFTIPEAQKRLGYKDYNSPKRAAAELLEMGFISPGGREKYEKSFLAKEILEIIS